MRKVKCPICGLYFDRDKEKNVQIKTRFYHINCLSETSEGNRMILEEYIKDILEIDKISPLIKKQIKKYTEEDGMTYLEIRDTLKYFFELKNGNKTKAQGIGIVPYVYDEAKKYYQKIYDITEKAKKVEIKSNIEKNINISRPFSKVKRRRIDINSL